MVSRKRGLVLTVGSFAALIPSPLLAVYSGSKAFVSTWSQALGSELEGSGVTVELLNTYFVVRHPPLSFYLSLLAHHLIRSTAILGIEVEQDP